MLHRYKYANILLFEQMQSKLLEDERQWQNEFGNLPSMDRSSKETSSSSECRYSKRGAKYLNLTEFSGIVGDGGRYSSNMSMGNFFSTRCEDVRQIITTKSPTKRLKPVALVESKLESGEIETCEIDNIRRCFSDNCKFIFQ